MGIARSQVFCALAQTREDATGTTLTKVGRARGAVKGTQPGATVIHLLSFKYYPMVGKDGHWQLRDEIAIPVHQS